MKIESRLGTQPSVYPGNRARTIFRHVSGPELDPVIAQVGQLAAKAPNLIDMPFDRYGKIKPRAIIINSTELVNNCDRIDPRLTRRAETRAELATRLPAACAPKQAQLDKVKVDIRPGSRSYINLLFEEDAASDLADERADFWREIEDLTDTTSQGLEWADLKPNVLVASFSATIAPEAIEHVGQFVRKRLPFEVTLSPIYDSPETYLHSQDTQ